MKQVVKHQQKASQDKGHRPQLGVHVYGQFQNGLDTKGQDRPAALLWEVVENKQQQLEVLNIQIFCVIRKSPLQSILFQCGHKPASNRKEDR